MIPKSSKTSSEVEFVDVSHINFKTRTTAAEPEFEIPNEIRKSDISKDFINKRLTCETSTNSTLLDFLKRAVPLNPQ